MPVETEVTLSVEEKWGPEKAIVQPNIGSPGETFGGPSKTDNKCGISICSENVIGDRAEAVGKVERGGECTWVGGCMNLIKTMIGAGILALPYANAQVGWGMGLFSLFYGAVTTYMGFVLLTRCADWMGTSPSSYGKLCAMVYPKAAWTVDLCVLLSCFGSALSYLIIIGDLLPIVAVNFGAEPGTFLSHRLFWISIMFVAFDIPLTCLKNIDKLSYTSGVAFASIVYVVVLGLLFLIAPAGAPALDPCADALSLDSCKGEVVAVGDGVGFLRAFPTFIFAFNAHFIIFAIFDSLKKPTARKMEATVVVPSTIHTTILYGSFGLFGYFTYGAAVKSNILVNFPGTTPVTIARLLMSFVVAVTYPLYMHAARAALVNLFNTGFKATNRPNLVNNARTQLGIHWGSTVALLGLSFMIAAFMSNLGIVINLVGTVCGVPIGYILPGLFYCKAFGSMRKMAEPNHVDTTEDRMLWWSGVFLVVFGVVFLPLALVFMFV